MVSKEFMTIIEEDIVWCEKELKNPRISSDIHRTLCSKYGNIIDGFTDGLHNLFYDDSGKYEKMNIEIMRQKLVLFKTMGYENRYEKNDGRMTIQNTNQLIATINVSFEEARERVNNMTALPDEEIQEVLERINRIEEIVNSSERKSKKWDMAKDTIKWIADKGVDVGISLLPLLLKI